MKHLSVALAVYNEEKNIGRCLDAVKDIADEIVVVDGRSGDKTVEIARSLGAEVIIADNQPIFHINKQKAVDRCCGEWILQLDADEIVTPKLAEEIVKVISMDDTQLEEYQGSLKNKDLFLRHQRIIEIRDGQVGNKEGQFNAFFIPRLNFFLGKYLRYGGVYPDGVIRLIRKDQAYLPCKSVHEQMVVKGRVGWLQNDLLHIADPTFKRYLERNNRYIDLIASELQEGNIPKNIIWFLFFTVIKPVWWFFLTLFRHKGILDGLQGIIFSFFSALRFPKAYLRYMIECQISKRKSQN